MLVKGFYRQIIIGLIPFQTPLEDYFAPFTSKYTQKKNNKDSPETL